MFLFLRLTLSSSTPICKIYLRLASGSWVWSEVEKLLLLLSMWNWTDLKWEKEIQNYIILPMLLFIRFLKLRQEKWRKILQYSICQRSQKDDMIWIFYEYIQFISFRLRVLLSYASHIWLQSIFHLTLLQLFTSHSLLTPPPVPHFYSQVDLLGSKWSCYLLPPRCRSNGWLVKSWKVAVGWHLLQTAFKWK